MRRYLRLGCALAVLLAVAVMAPRIVSSREDIREVTIVVRNMTYHLEGSDEPNPSMRFRVGERVRLKLRNEDEGMSHDFSIRDWGVATKVLDGKGEDSIVFRVPARSTGSTTYTCTPHSAMMSGSIVVE
jgi:plastocyanin